MRFRAHLYLIERIATPNAGFEGSFRKGLTMSINATKLCLVEGTYMAQWVFSGWLRNILSGTHLMQ